jgi:putative oxidoreductase
MSKLYGAAEFIGRILLMALFLFAAFTKLTTYGAIQQYMASAGVPPALLPFAIIFELVGTVVIVWVGARARVRSCWPRTRLQPQSCFTSTSPTMETLMFLKNLSIAGAFWCWPRMAQALSVSTRASKLAPFDEGVGSLPGPEPLMILGELPPRRLSAAHCRGQASSRVADDIAAFAPRRSTRNMSNERRGIVKIGDRAPDSRWFLRRA